MIELSFNHLGCLTPSTRICASRVALPSDTDMRCTRTRMGDWSVKTCTVTQARPSGDASTKGVPADLRNGNWLSRRPGTPMRRTQGEITATDAARQGLIETKM